MFWLFTHWIHLVHCQVTVYFKSCDIVFMICCHQLGAFQQCVPAVHHLTDDRFIKITFRLWSVKIRPLGSIFGLENHSDNGGGGGAQHCLGYGIPQIFVVLDSKNKAEIMGATLAPPQFLRACRCKSVRPLAIACSLY